MKHFNFVACSAFVVLVSLFAGISQVAGADSDVRIGTWKLSLAKSTYAAGTEPQSVMRKYEAFEGDGVKYTAETVGADGKRMVETYSGHQDGKDYAWTGTPIRDAISMKRNDARSFEYTLKKDGKVVSTGRNVVSKDGNTMTIIGGVSATGQPGSVGVYDRQ